jgi:hypothetical protein
VSAHHLVDYTPDPNPTNGNGLGWAANMAAVPAAAAAAAAAAGAIGGSSAGSLLCFSRALDAPAAAVSKTLDPRGEG